MTNSSILIKLLCTPLLKGITTFHEFLNMKQQASFSNIISVKYDPYLHTNIKINLRIDEQPYILHIQYYYENENE